MSAPVTGAARDHNATHRVADPSHQVAGLSFTPEQLEARRRTLGASEVPAVLGLDRYKSAHDIWLSKRGLVPPFAGNPATEWGLRVEPVIRQKVADTFGVEIEQPGTLIHPAHAWASATPDGVLTLDGEPHVLEIKNKSDRQSVYWGVSGTDEVPHDIAAQVYWQMAVMGLERAVVAVLFGKSDFRLYHLVRDAEISTSIFETCGEFWARYIEGWEEPEITGSRTTRDYLTGKFAGHGDTLRDATTAEARLIEELREVRATIKGHEERKELLETKILAAIGHDAGLQCRAGRVTWKAPKGLQTKWKDVALAMQAPQSIIDQFSSAMARRFLATFPKED